MNTTSIEGFGNDNQFLAIQDPPETKLKQRSW